MLKVYKQILVQSGIFHWSHHILCCFGSKYSTWTIRLLHAQMFYGFLTANPVYIHPHSTFSATRPWNFHCGYLICECSKHSRPQRLNAIPMPTYQHLYLYIFNLSLKVQFIIWGTIQHCWGCLSALTTNILCTLHKLSTYSYLLQNGYSTGKPQYQLYKGLGLRLRGRVQ